VSNNKIAQAMELGAALRKERYEEILEDLYYGVEDRMNSLKKANPDFETKEIVELLQVIEEMLHVVPEVGNE
jgi:hypothetical protein|tara:strand:- start:62 stop:277 length:216 start_codon:yes stop_codon:yes gene_type:complete